MIFTDETASDKLSSVTKYAHEINKHLLELAYEWSSSKPIHFRPTSSGITLLSLSQEKPQIGKGGFGCAKELRDGINTEYEAHIVNHKPPARPTPEKQVQSFLIRNAYLKKGRMDILEQACRQCGDEIELKFVTDEIPIPVIKDGKKGKIVCDLLALKTHENGETQPVLIELKSSRQKKELIRQLTDYSGLIVELKTEFEALYSALLWKAIMFKMPVEKWIVWPSAYGTFQQDPRVSDPELADVRLIQYLPGFTFHADRTE